MHILYVTNYFPPEVGTGPHLPFEMGQWLVQAGHQVTVVTGFPRYNLPVMPPQYRGRLFFREEMAGMQVLRINAPNFYGKSRFSRGAVQLLTPPFHTFCALGVRRPDVVFTDIPPIFLGVSVRFLSWWFNAPCVAYVMDLFPQNIVDAGAMRNKHVIRFFERIERYVYRNVSALTTVAHDYRDFAIRRGADPDRTVVIPLWADTDEIRPCPRLNGFRATHNLGEDFVVTYAGTMGFAQGLEVVIEAARRLANEPGLLFLMVGDGVERERLERQASALTNVRFLPMQPKAVYPQVLAASDGCLSTLRPEMTTPTIPSKIMTIMAAGRPVLCSFGPGDAARLVTEAECGLVTTPGDAEALAQAVLKLKRDPETARRMGDNGGTHAEKHLSRPACVGQLEQVFQKAVAEYAISGRNADARRRSSA